MDSRYPEIPQELIANAVGWLQQLIRIDTTNPPGNEQELVRHISPILADAGIPTAVLELESGRSNLIAGPLAVGKSAGQVLLSSHADTVPIVQPEAWQVAALSGAEVDGAIWGRGALDMKFKIAFDLACMLWATANGCADQVSQVVVAGEETGGEVGSQFLSKKFTQQLVGVHVVNEIGGFPLYIAGTPILLLQSGEKGHFSFRVHLAGGSIHASTPINSMRLDKVLGPFLSLAERVETYALCASTRSFLSAFEACAPESMSNVVKCLSDPSQVQAALAMLESFDPVLAAQLRGMLYNVCTPTMCSLGAAPNIASATGSIHFDARLVPGQSAQRFQQLVEDSVAEISTRMGVPAKVEVVGASDGFEIELTDSLYSHCASVVAETWGTQLGGAPVAPFLLPASSDSAHYYRSGAVPLGFSPLLFETDFPGLSLVHGVNERVSRKAFEAGLRLYIQAIGSFLQKS